MRIKPNIEDIIGWQLDLLGESPKVFIFTDATKDILEKKEIHRIDFDNSETIFGEFKDKYFLKVELDNGILTCKFERSWNSVLDFFTYIKEDPFSISTLFYYSGKLAKADHDIELKGRYRFIFSWRLIHFINLIFALILTVFPLLHFITALVGFSEYLNCLVYISLGLGGCILLIVDVWVGRILKKYSSKFKDVMFKSIELHFSTSTESDTH